MTTTGLVFHRRIAYSDRELYRALMDYLDHTYVFVKLEIDQWLGKDRVIYSRRDRCESDLLNSVLSAEELWFDGFFEDWTDCTTISVKNICSEFIFKNGSLIGKHRKTMIRDMVKTEINHGSLIVNVKFNPILKQVIAGGRKKVKGIKPLSCFSQKRTSVELKEGDLCYFCWNTKNPYVANPAYVFRKLASSYIIIFFSHQKNGTETSKLEINTGRFINATADELGKTPEQAVLQRFC